MFRWPGKGTQVLGRLGGSEKRKRTWTLTLWWALLGFATDTDPAPVIGQEGNACPDQCVADGRNNFIPRRGSPLKVISNHW
jgi:hypothetical protein